MSRTLTLIPVHQASKQRNERASKYSHALTLVTDESQHTEFEELILARAHALGLYAFNVQGYNWVQKHETGPLRQYSCLN